MSSWSLEEKSKLVTLLRKYGTGDLEFIQQKIPNKTLPEIQYICHKHKLLAMKKWQKREKKYDAVIKKWVLVLKRLKNAKNKPIQNIIPRLLNYIALFEKREEFSHINLSKCYQILSDISDGKPFTPGDDTHDYFINNCLVRLAGCIKNGEVRSFTNHLRSLRTLSDLVPNQQQGDSNTTDILNLLAIPEKLLKMSETEKLSNTI